MITNCQKQNKTNKQNDKKQQQQPTKLDPFIVTVLQQCYAIINFCQHQISQLYHYSITKKCMNIGEYIVEDRIRHIHWQPLDMCLGSTWTGT